MMTPSQTKPEPNRATLAEILEGYIVLRACGQIRDLRVHCNEDESKIILIGRSKTYHAKQLAQEAVFDVAGERTVLSNRIEVRN